MAKRFEPVCRNKWHIHHASKVGGQIFLCVDGEVWYQEVGNPAHMESNAMLDFTISDEDMEALKNIKHIKNYGEHSGFPVFGGKM